ncbi:YjbH domain-containing protein [Thaumasiovibrio subtropicus]|nr:YjbH domain-containing protein [Thaumasiovibrio subtropicus]
MSNQSFTGLINVPNAQVVDFGDLNFSYGKGLPKGKGDRRYGTIADLDNWVGALGFMPGVEGVGRVVTETYDCNIYFDPGCGIRDLSASLKVQIPFVYELAGVHVAVGMQDIGGAASNYDAKYIVADKTFSAFPVRVSAGYGQSEMAADTMNGVFAGFEYQPFSFAQVVGEYDSAELNAAIRLFTPEGLLPLDSQLGLQYQIYSSHDSDTNVWNLNASIPLVGRDRNKRYETLQEEITIEENLVVEFSQAEAASDAALVDALLDEGFLNVRLGERALESGKTINVIALEDRRYNHNKADALGVALGIVASHSSSESDVNDIEVILRANDVPMVAVETNAACFREFLLSGVPCSSTQFATMGLSKRIESTNWRGEKQASGFGRLQVVAGPSLYHALATEYGFFDYSLALATNAYLPLWYGAAIDVRHFTPLSNSDDYDDGKLWASGRHENEIDRVMIHQTFRLPFNIYSQFSAGRSFGTYDGWLNETVWNSPKGMHTLGLQVSEWEPKDRYDSRGRYIKNRETELYSYTLNLPQFNWQGQFETGRYFSGDEGYSVYSNHWVGDTKITARYLKSEEEEFLTLGVTIPLTFNRDMKPGYVQVRGMDEFEYAIQTRIGDSHNNLNTGLGNRIRMQNRLERRYLNRNRMSPSYFEANIQRLRNAYLNYLNVRK